MTATSEAVRRKTARVIDTAAPAAPEATENELRHYSIQQAADLLGVSKRWLAGKVADRAVPHTFLANQTKFRAEHILQISRAGEVDPATRGRRQRAA
ncbi:hypothetical protein [Kitasatospora cheerisanensis]|uniref:Helix-turn-helix domain-containing protein n=1 Tax=Kitasatospora cheerisanensis KCTC 2395 TaxID=1348663 RepID=A0A066YQB0_9ACTN|nr:hypothetical protein [Kitasatospora cheerisanensis]KDN83442.1 hypothetical protein KCH_49240 [Kitasatospora cheerisanensis KCTC 2395]